MTAKSTLVVALVIGFVGCGGGGGGDGGHDSAQVPSAAELAGTYDLTARQGGSSPDSVGQVNVDGDKLRVGMILNGSVNVSGVLRDDGSIELEGTQLVGDVLNPVTGSARAEERDGVRRISGHIRIAGADLDFTMERPVGADVSVFRGRYELVFAKSPSPCHCATTAEISVIIGADGTGTSSAADEFNASAIAVAFFEPGAALVSPSGRLSLSMAYSTPPHAGCAPVTGIGPCAIRLSGTLSPPDDGSATSGRFHLESPLTLMHLGDGDFTVVRVNSNG